MSYTLYRGHAPLLVSLPHVGTELTADQRPRYVPRALEFEDTDWFLEQLYDFVRPLGASLLVPRYSRYLIDLNRSNLNTPMYAGQNNTELCPTRFFTGDPLYLDGQAPDEAEIARRVQQYWQPYHDALGGELARIHAQHGHAVLFDGHSIKSQLPWLFSGELPHMNLGTAEGRSCHPTLRAALGNCLAAQSEFSHVVDGRFKGGHITRHWGRPDQGLHAVQLEMCWRAYMNESGTPRWDPQVAAGVTPLLRGLVQTMLDWRPR